VRKVSRKGDRRGERKSFNNGWGGREYLENLMPAGEKKDDQMQNPRLSIGRGKAPRPATV